MVERLLGKKKVEGPIPSLGSKITTSSPSGCPKPPVSSPERIGSVFDVSLTQYTTVIYCGLSSLEISPSRRANSRARMEKVDGTTRSLAISCKTPGVAPTPVGLYPRSAIARAARFPEGNRPPRWQKPIQAVNLHLALAPRRSRYSQSY